MNKDKDNDNDNAPQFPVMSSAFQMLEERFNIIKSVGEECSQKDELLDLLKHNPHPICCDMFVPYGRMDIVEGIMKTINVNKLTSAGCRVKIWIADNVAKLNKEMGDDDKIKTVGNYFIEIWKALGMDVEAGKVEFLWAKEETKARRGEYWGMVTDIARVTRCSQIIGLNQQDKPTGSDVFYPCMQCAAIFFLKADICQLGMDQCVVKMLARDYGDISKRGNKPIILSQRMIPGLQQTDSSAAIYMDDEQADVNSKIKKAYCPPKIIEGNPCLDYLKYLIFPWFKEFKVERKAENGGNKIYSSFEELQVEYEEGVLHPSDLKPALSKALNKILQPVRDHFANNHDANEHVKKVKSHRRKKKTNVSSRGNPTKEDNAKHLQIHALSIIDAPHSRSLMSASQMLEERFRIIRSVGEECIDDQELRDLLKDKPHPICYDGFEPSGRMHVAQGVMKKINVNKLTSAGCQVKIWIADWFAQLNNKLGGDIEKIKTIGKYFIEIWKAVGMDIEAGKVEFSWSQEEIKAWEDDYWDMVMDIASSFRLSRLRRCCQIMGRKEHDELTAAQIFYPCMQCSDIFFLKADICQLGMDQRKVNMLAREYCDIIKRKNKPIILSHHMIPGLQQGQEKMSKSDSSSAIYMEDEEVDVISKIEKAYCPPNTVEGNPCLEYLKYLIFPWFKEFRIESKIEYGGNKTYCCFDELAVDYEAGVLLSDDIKPALSKALNKILQPVRDHFATNSEANELLKKVKLYRVTR